VPARGPLTAELVPPVSGVTFTVTVVPSGMFEAVSETVIGLGVPAGTTMSGTEKEPVGEAGAATPAVDAIRKLGAFGSATTPGGPADGPAPVKLIVVVLLNASIRTRPPLPPPPMANT
jgi:hypothetical protein